MLAMPPGLGMTFMHTPASFSRTQFVADATDDVVRRGGCGGGKGRERERERGVGNVYPVPIITALRPA
jgi:hypothetical protein